MFFPIVIIEATLFPIFAIANDSISDRLASTSTITLTAVAFLTVVSDELPRAPELSLLDVYIVWLFLMCTVQTFETPVLRFVAVTEAQRNGVDWLTFILLLVMGILQHAQFVVMSRVALVRSSELEQLVANDGSRPQQPKSPSETTETPRGHWQLRWKRGRRASAVIQAMHALVGGGGGRKRADQAEKAE